MPLKISFSVVLCLYFHACIWCSMFYFIMHESEKFCSPWSVGLKMWFSLEKKSLFWVSMKSCRKLCLIFVLAFIFALSIFVLTFCAKCSMHFAVVKLFSLVLGWFGAHHLYFFSYRPVSLKLLGLLLNYYKLFFEFKTSVI